MRGSLYGFLSAHPIAPLVSLHHLDDVDPIIPGRSQHDALQSLLGAARLDPSRVLQQSFCYDSRRGRSFSVSWGYTAQIYPHILSPNDLSMPLRTFRTWRSYQDGPFTFNTRPWADDPCERPLLYFVERVDDLGEGGTRTAYYRQKKDRKEECAKTEYVAALEIEKITVLAPRMMPHDWRKVSHHPTSPFSFLH